VLVNFEFAAKAKDCTSMNAEDCWCKQEGTDTASYHCEIIEEDE
jgi:hypothetical protein